MKEEGYALNKVGISRTRIGSNFGLITNKYERKLRRTKNDSNLLISDVS